MIISAKCVTYLTFGRNKEGHSRRVTYVYCGQIEGKVSFESHDSQT